MNYVALYALIRKYEGLRLRPYLCPAGVPTIGYGTTGAHVTMQSPPITPSIAEEMMREDAKRYAAAVIKMSPILALYPDIAAAMADFVYNLGPARYKSSTLKKKVDAGDWDGVVEQLRKWVWGGGKRLPGLVARREEEARLIIRSSRSLQT